MKKLVLILVAVIITASLSAQEKENTKIDSLYQEIQKLQSQIELLQDSIQDCILENGYPIQVKEKYRFSEIKLFDSEYGNVLDTIHGKDIIKVIDKTTSYVIVEHKGKTGYVYISDLDIENDSPLNYLLPSYLRKSKSKNSNYSTGSGSGGSVNVKGYYRKDGTYVKPHTRSTPKSSSRGRRR
jgi:hypothetical protein